MTAAERAAVQAAAEIEIVRFMKLFLLDWVVSLVKKAELITNFGLLKLDLQHSVSALRHSFVKIVVIFI
jgi:hypothetical protein